MTHKKRIGLLVLTALMAIIMTIPGYSASASWFSDYTMEAIRAKATPTIDGTVSTGEWDGAQVFTIVPDDPAVNNHGWLGQGSKWQKASDEIDFKVSISVMWDDEYLYVLDKRNDEHLHLDGTQKAWGTDGGVLMIQCAGKDSGINNNGVMHFLYYQLGTTDKTIGGSLVSRLVTEGTGALGSYTDPYLGTKIKTSATDTGWQAEIAVPWAWMKNDVPAFSPSEGSEIQLGFYIGDTDEGANNNFALIHIKKDALPAGQSGDNNKGGYGVVKLKGDGGTQEQTTATATTTTSPTTSDYTIAYIFAFAAVVVISLTVAKKRLKTN